jgi:hypothetical protein
MVKGKPLKYLRGHQNRIRLELDNDRHFKIDGEPCRLIPLTRGLYAIVDADNYEWFMQWKWHASWMGDVNAYYAHRNLRVDETGDSSLHQVISMHRAVMGLSYGDERKVDHKYSLATLDNRRSNLRFTDTGGNAQNAKLPCTNTTGFRGVVYYPGRRAFSVFIQENRKTKYLGRYIDVEVAARVWDREALRIYGEFARLNFPKEIELRRAELADQGMMIGCVKLLNAAS